MEENQEIHPSKDINEEFLKFQADMKNPLVVGALISALKDERSSTNLILKEINVKLDRLVASLDQKQSNQGIMLAEVDEEIMTFLKEKGRADAEQVQTHFQYKGKNAASARLNGLYRMGLVDKKQVGKKVYFVKKWTV